MAELTDQEAQILKITATLFNRLAALPVQHPLDLEEYVHAIHDIQARVLSRPTIRILALHPDPNMRTVCNES